MSVRLAWPSLALAALCLALACGETSEERPRAAAPEAPQAPTAAQAPAVPATPASLPRGLLVAISVFERGDAGPIPKSRLMVLRRRDGRWQAESFEDPASNVFHKALMYAPPDAEPGIVTLGGSAAAVKLWRAGEGGGLAPVATLWESDFGGKFSRMRDAEVADLDGDGEPELAVATHDQGVVAVLDPAGGAYAVRELDREAGKFVHEIEVGDLDGDGTPEIYATPSDPNKLDGRAQHGEVVRYAPGGGERTVVADLDGRHAKEILVGDVDGDGRDELYVSVEDAKGGDVEIRRFESGTAASAGAVIATLPDTMSRFLTAGDVDGDGRREMVAAGKDSGLWLLRPGEDPNGRWTRSAIDAKSRGFEHAALLGDLDGDGRDELYVASDDDRELRRYVWTGAAFARETIHRHEGELPLLTWNLAPFPADLF